MSDVVLSGVVKSFGPVRAVQDVSLEIERGELMAVLGPSGCGKTTLLRLVAGFERPDEGRIAVGGRELAGPETFVMPENRRVGIVFQDYALFPHLTVKANVAFGLTRRERDERERLTQRTLELVGLQHKAERHPHELSGGERQRVALARALAPAPGADPAGRAVLEPRRDAPRRAAPGGGADPARRRRHGAARDARPGGGALAGRPAGRDARGADSPGGRPAGGLRAPGQPLDRGVRGRRERACRGGARLGRGDRARRVRRGGSRRRRGARGGAPGAARAAPRRRAATRRWWHASSAATTFSTACATRAGAPCWCSCPRSSSTRWARGCSCARCRTRSHASSTSPRRRCGPRDACDGHPGGCPPRHHPGAAGVARGARDLRPARLGPDRRARRRTAGRGAAAGGRSRPAPPGARRRSRAARRHRAGARRLRPEARTRGIPARVGPVLRIEARTAAGAFYGTRSVVQLLRRKRSIPAGTRARLAPLPRARADARQRPRYFSPRWLRPGSASSRTSSSTSCTCTSPTTRASGSRAARIPRSCPTRTSPSARCGGSWRTRGAATSA